MQLFVSDPEVASDVSESNFEIFPGTVEESRTTVMLLNQNTWK
jgi:hypothetical protein